MDSSFGVFDAFAFVVFAVLIVAAVVVIVSLGQLPGQLARKWGHPQAAAVNAASWIGLATGGLLWPLALIWAFIIPPGTVSPNPRHGGQRLPGAEPNYLGIDAARATHEGEEKR
jgi:hypothetical protein